MIYSFEQESAKLREFISQLDDRALDYEIIRKDKVVVRVFGFVDDSLKNRLDTIAEQPGKLVLKREGETSSARPHPFLDNQAIIAGPCSIESEKQIDTIASFLADRGVRYLRGGAFKPRTNSASFQGLGRGGLKLMAEAAARYGMKVVTEVMDRSQLDDVSAFADIIQVGSRNMFNYSLLTALGAVEKPVLLKRGMAATIDEWVQASDYIRKGGNEAVILCERGIRTFEPRTRFTLDILAVPIAREMSGLPVVVDVSHAAGDRRLVPPLVRAALAAGADGVMIEVHHDPATALSDGRQSLTFEDFESVLKSIQAGGLLRPAQPKE